MAAPEPVDLRHLGRERVIGCYVVDSDDGPALVDCGPSTCLPALVAGLERQGLALSDVRHLLLSHVHPDHAGAAGALVRRHPGLQVHVSPAGAPHVVDPFRLERGARRFYGERFDHLWGELAPVPEENVRVVGSRVVGLDCFPSPGHVSDHVCYLDADGTLYAGDAAGVRVQPGRAVVPPTPPPELDVAAWETTLDELERRAPDRLALVHFGVADDPARHLAELRLTLLDWAEAVEGGASEEEFVTYARQELEIAGEDAAAYEQPIAFGESYAGLRRWADTRVE